MVDQESVTSPIGLEQKRADRAIFRFKQLAQSSGKLSARWKRRSHLARQIAEGFADRLQLWLQMLVSKKLKDIQRSIHQVVLGAPRQAVRSGHSSLQRARARVGSPFRGFGSTVIFQVFGKAWFFKLLAFVAVFADQPFSRLTRCQSSSNR